jgi:NAD(P)-dependent dehydrogenase (short-subunit alcohol dehydrogenase family)
MDRFSLRGQVAAVTGAGSGLGLAIAEVLAEAGAHVALLDLDPAGLAAAQARVPGAETHVLDVADRAAVRRVLAGVAQAHGRLDIAVANAGITAGPGYLTDTGHMAAVDDAQWDRVLSVNLSGVFATIQAASVPMKTQGYGRILAIASVAGLKSEVMVGYAYAATKAAVVNLVRQSAMELAPHGVTVNAIAPGAVPHQHRRRPHPPARNRRTVRRDGPHGPHRRPRGDQGPCPVAVLSCIQLHDRHHHSGGWRHHGALRGSHDPHRPDPANRLCHRRHPRQHGQPDPRFRRGTVVLARTRGFPAPDLSRPAGADRAVHCDGLCRGDALRTDPAAGR